MRCRAERSGAVPGRAGPGGALRRGGRGRSCRRSGAAARAGPARCPPARAAAATASSRPAPPPAAVATPTPLGQPISRRARGGGAGWAGPAARGGGAHPVRARRGLRERAGGGRAAPGRAPLGPVRTGRLEGSLEGLAPACPAPRPAPRVAPRLQGCVETRTAACGGGGGAPAPRPRGWAPPGCRFCPPVKHLCQSLFR